MKQLSRTKKLLFIVLAINLLGAGSYAFLLWSLENTRSNTLKLSTEAQADFTKDDYLRMARMDLSTNSQKISLLNSYFVSKNGVPELIEYIEALENVSGAKVYVGSVSVEQDTKNKDEFKELLRLKVESEGSWQEVNTFLVAIESLPFRVKIDNLSFNRQGSGEELLFGDKDSVGKDVATWKGYVEFTVLKFK